VWTPARLNRLCCSDHGMTTSCRASSKDLFRTLSSIDPVIIQLCTTVCRLHTLLKRCTSFYLRGVTSTTVVARAPPPVRHATCGDLLVAWRNGSMLDDRDGPEIEAIAASILLRNSPPHVCLRHANGRKVVYARKITPCKPVVGRSQGYRRTSHGIRLLSNSVGGQASAAVVGGAVSISLAGYNCPGNRGSGALAPITATPEQQVGLITRHGVSLAAFSGIRIGLGWSGVGLASIPAFENLASD